MVSRNTKINEGMHVDMEESSLDIIVRSFEGSVRRRKAKFEVRLNGEIQFVELSWNQDFYEITPGVKIKVRQGATSRNMVPVVYYLDNKDYTFQRTNYE